MAPFAFLVGRGRSGTTLLRAILDSHPQLAIPDETHFLVGMAGMRDRFELGGGFCVGAFVDDLVARPGFASFGLSPGEVRRHLEAAPPLDYAAAVRAVFACYAASRGKTRYGDKTPLHVLHLPELARTFSDARFVHIIRDGRDVALSYLDVPWGAESVEEAAFLWKRAVETGRRDGRALGPQRYLEVRYEDLVDDPEGTVRQLCRFLELDFDPAMLRYYERAGEVAATMGRPETRTGLYRPPTKGLRDWRRQMEPGDVARFELIAGDLLATLGYGRASCGAGVGVRLGAGGRWLAVQGGRVRRRASKVRRRTLRRWRRWASRR
ncbi:MAG TPA: sulfotransferase [Acidimicrobiales bacterium]|nr:sulfotransferase [Acidimicrobiales bacterium]